MNKSKKISLPDSFISAHTLCYMNHDVLVQLLKSGEKQEVFWHSINLQDENDQKRLEEAEDIFEWLELTNQLQERTKLLRKVIFPALLSDFLHFIYEALNCSKKAKLSVTFTLLRKPLQESLFTFELIVADLDKFGELMVNDPTSLYSQAAGGIDVHIKRIRKVLGIIGKSQCFDAEYLARLRYDKNAEDSFDGISNKAIHLFTGHKAIRTEPLNINFIFSGWDAKISQWQYLYSRLPYILSYSRYLIEYVCSTFVKTDPLYLLDIERRIAAATLLWDKDLEKRYRQESIQRFIKENKSFLVEQCKTFPTTNDLISISTTGEFSGQPSWQVFK